MLSCFSHVWLCAILWTAACQGALSVGFSRKEYWSRLSFPPLGVFPTQASKLHLLCLPALAGGLFTTSATGEQLTQNSYFANRWPYMSFKKEKKKRKKRKLPCNWVGKKEKNRNQNRACAPGRGLWMRNVSFTLGRLLTSREIRLDPRGVSESKKW